MSELKGGARIASMLEELAQAAERVGLQVRRERLLREVGYRARGGACRLREKDLVIIDSAQPPAEQLEVLLEALRTRDLETLYLSPAARRLLQNQAEQAGQSDQSDRADLSGQTGQTGPTGKAGPTGRTGQAGHG